MSGPPKADLGSARRRRRGLRLAALVLGVAVIAGSVAGDASAKAGAASKKDPIGRLKQKVDKCKQSGGGGALNNTLCDVGGAAQGLSDPAVTAEAAAQQQLGANGQVDPITGLGIRNPVCDRPGEIRDRATQVGCRSSGTPEGIYPASNFGFDIFIDTGIDAPTGTFVKGFVFILDGIWLGLLFVLKLVLSLLGLAFGLNPFSDGETMRGITRGIHGFYSEVTQPWLDALVVFLGIGLAWRGLVKRELAASVGGTLAAIALLLVGMWVINRPSESVGRLAEMSDQMALGVIAAPQDGVSRPTGSYAEAMSQTWERLVEVPFAGLDFSDVRWAMGPPPKEAVAKAGEAYCQDVGVPALLGIAAAKSGGCARLARQRFGQPRRVIDLYLRSSPGSPSRKALWDYFDNDPHYKPKVAAQGGDGALTRLAMVALFGIGMLGAILLLAWLAIRLFMQAAIAFFLLLIAPFALFFPAFGDTGRRAFRTWGLTLLGAVIAKVVYAAFLAVVVLGIGILGRVGDDGGAATGFLLACAFTWAIFLKRAEMVGWMSIGDAQHDHGAIGRVAAFAIGSKVGSAAARGVGQSGTRAGRWASGRTADKSVATARVAGDTMRERAAALGDERYREAQQTVRAFEARSRGGSGEFEGAGAERYRRAQSLIAKVDENKRTLGRRWDDGDLARFAEEDRRLLADSRNPADHAHRAGYSRAQFEQLQGEERQRAEATIEKAIKRDKSRIGVISDRPGRIAGLSERARQSSSAHEIAQRHRHLRDLRRARRASPSARRHLSRGG
jgi:hypothetical protein